jgi:hypothetical protein
MRVISVKEAKYLNDYKIEILFNDNKKKIVDFGAFLNKHSHPQFNKYKQAKYFKKFQIENGNVVWGKDWDMIFPVYDLYRGEIK